MEENFCVFRKGPAYRPAYGEPLKGCCPHHHQPPFFFFFFFFFSFEAGFSIVTLAGLEVIEIPLPLPSITPIRSLVEAASGGKWEVQAPEGG